MDITDIMFSDVDMRPPRYNAKYNAHVLITRCFQK